MEEQRKRRIAKQSSNAQTAEETALLLSTPDMSGWNTGRVQFLRLRTRRSKLIPDVSGVHTGPVCWTAQSDFGRKIENLINQCPNIVKFET